MSDGLFAGFGKPRQVMGRASVADLFGQRRRCGLYILHFKTGELYAGQAVDVTSRYVQHCKVHEDIEFLAFRPLAKGRLDEEERSLIHRLEGSGYKLRNIVHTSVPFGPSDLDLVVDPAAQDRWVATGQQPGTAKRIRAVDHDLRRKYQRKCEQLLATPEGEAVVALLRLYVGTTILAPRLTELAFWSVSCLPADSLARRGERVLARVNINWQVGLTISTYAGDLECSVYGAQSVRAGWTGASNLAEIPGLTESQNLLGPGGHDQFNLIARGAEAMDRLLSSPDVIAAARAFNVRLMRKGPCAYSRYHCLSLADHLVD